MATVVDAKSKFGEFYGPKHMINPERLLPRASRTAPHKLRGMSAIQDSNEFRHARFRYLEG